MELREIGAERFAVEVLQASKPILVDFFGEWCMPCKRLGPILEELAPQVEQQFGIVKINVAKERSLAEQYGVMNIPTMILFKNGMAVHRLVGVKTQDKIIEEIQPFL